MLAKQAADIREKRGWVWCWVIGDESRRIPIYDTELEGAHEVVLADLDWSPDGRFLACVLERNKYATFEVLNVAGPRGGLERLESMKSWSTASNLLVEQDILDGS